MKKKKLLELTESNYYSPEANNEYFSVSQFKDFMNCEAQALAKIQGKFKLEPTKPMLIGSYIDRHFEGTLEAFKKENPAIFTQKGALKAEFKQAEQIIGRVTKDALFMRFMSGNRQTIMTFELFGVPWKMKMDSYIPHTCITDLKVVADFTSIRKYRYDIQGTIYQKGVEIVTGEKLPFYLAVATKEKITDLDIFQIDQNTLDNALEDVELLIDRFNQVKKGEVDPVGCGKCEWCLRYKKASVRNFLEV